MSGKTETIVRVGPAGWSYDDWKGIVYPPGMPKNLHPVEFLCEYFDTIEINSSFYYPSSPRNCARWATLANANPLFKFTAKLYKAFTHERETWPDASVIDAVRRGFDALMAGGKLGAVLIQFPWSFKRMVDNRKWLAAVMDAFNQYPLALEVRHASWNCPEVCEELRRRSVAFCNIDQPIFSNSIKPDDKVTAPVGYVRLHGRNTDNWFREDAGRNDRYDYLYGMDELKEWLVKIENIRAQAEELYAITNNHYRGQAVVNAFELQRELGVGGQKAPPDSLLREYPRLAE